jgi:sporulation-control protein
MFKKFLATLGVGGANIDFALKDTSVRAGEVLNGIVRVAPGSLNQRVGSIEFRLVAQSRVEDRSVTTEIDRQKTAEAFEITAGGRPFEMPVNYRIPSRSPVSTQFTRLSLTTALDSDAVIDPSDVDRITVLPEVRVQLVMNALHELGFRENSRDSGRFNGRWQEFEYIPAGTRARHIKELDVIYDVRPDGIMLLAEVEKRSLLLDVLNLEELAEKRIRVFISNDFFQNTGSVARELDRKLISSL